MNDVQHFRDENTTKSFAGENIAAHTWRHSLSIRASKPRMVLHLGSKMIWAREVTCSVESVPSVPWIKTDAPSLGKKIYFNKRNCLMSLSCITHTAKDYLAEKQVQLTTASKLKNWNFRSPSFSCKSIYPAIHPHFYKYFPESTN